MLWLLPLCVPYLGDVTRWELRAWPTSILKDRGVGKLLEERGHQVHPPCWIELPREERTYDIVTSLRRIAGRTASTVIAALRRWCVAGPRALLGTAGEVDVAYPRQRSHEAEETFLIQYGYGKNAVTIYAVRVLRAARRESNLDDRFRSVVIRHPPVFAAVRSIRNNENLCRRAVRHCPQIFTWVGVKVGVTSALYHLSAARSFGPRN